MQPSPKIHLLLSSIICLFFSSCSISKFKHPKECHRVIITKKTFAPVFQETKASKFKATIDVLKNHLSGIVIVKQTDSVSTHIIFVTEDSGYWKYAIKQNVSIPAMPTTYNFSLPETVTADRASFIAAIKALP